MVGAAQPVRIIGRYALYGKIASGGMASVHLGRLVGAVGFSRTVAIKRMHAHVAEDVGFVSMFLDEGRLAARIRHPNVVPTLDIVSLDEELFIVMELVHGESLAGLCRSSTEKKELVPPDVAASVLVGVLHGLHAVHEATSDRGEPLDIVHRDVSPQNILVGTDGVARVLDFGVAKAAGRLQMTREGQLKGKLAYMAPEQVSGDASRASDVYAASVVLWETLAGRRLFRAENDAELLEKVLHGCDTPPSHFAPGIPGSLDRVTMRGLARDRTERYATAREMARALEEAIPLATASKVGDWVEAMAASSLVARSELIARIESDTSLNAASAGTVSRGDERDDREGDPTERADREAAPASDPELAVATRFSATVHVPERQRRARTIAPWLAGAGLLVLGAAGGGLSRPLWSAPAASIATAFPIPSAQPSAAASVTNLDDGVPPNVDAPTASTAVAPPTSAAPSAAPPVRRSRTPPASLPIARGTRSAPTIENPPGAQAPSASAPAPTVAPAPPPPTLDPLGERK